MIISAAQYSSYVVAGGLGQGFAYFLQNGNVYGDCLQNGNVYGDYFTPFSMTIVKRNCCNK